MLADLLRTDPDAAFDRVLAEAGTALSAAEVKAALGATGVDPAELGRRWKSYQSRVRSRDDIATEGNRYRYAPPPDPDPAAALEAIAAGGLPSAKKARYVEIVSAALSVGGPDPADAARQRQAKIDAIRTLADLASVVEEMTASEVEPGVLVNKVRTWVKRSGLEPIERAGEETTFDRHDTSRSAVNRRRRRRGCRSSRASLDGTGRKKY